MLNIIVGLAGIIISAIITFVDMRFGLDNKFLQAAMVTVLTTLTFHYITFSEKFKKEADNIQKKYISQSNKLDVLTRKDYIFKEYYSVEHPYFKHVLQNKIMDLIESDEVQTLINGTYVTNPQAQDTYGVNGLDYTEEFGNILFFSSIHDFWDDWRNVKDGKYLAKQVELMKYKNVSITRIFSINKSEFEKVKQLMKYQAELGIDVFYIFKDESSNQTIQDEWLEEDYLIQDEKLLVDLVPDNTKEDNHINRTEVITTKTIIVERKLQKYLHILERAIRYKSILENSKKEVS